MPPTRRRICCASSRVRDDVTVCPRESGLRFVGAPTWAALSTIRRIRRVDRRRAGATTSKLGRGADLVVVAPATADLMARASHGLADEPAHQYAADCAMSRAVRPGHAYQMWNHPATADNVATLAGASARGCSSPLSVDSPAPYRQGAPCPSAEIAQLTELFAGPPRCAAARFVGRQRSRLLPAALASQSIRCGSSERVVRAAGIRCSRRSPRPAGQRGHPGRGHTDFPRSGRHNCRAE